MLVQQIHCPRLGWLLFLVAWADLVLLLCLIGSRFHQIENGEHRLVLSVGLSAPLLFIRIVYPLLAAFSGDLKFNMITGGPTILLVTAILEEIAIVGVCLSTGLTLSTPDIVVNDHLFVR